MSDAAIAVSEGRGLFERVGKMLAWAGLDPSPRHYELCYRYLAGEDEPFRHMVDHTVAKCGGYTPVAVATILAQQGVELSADDLARMADQAQAQIEAITGLVDRSGADARAYGAALKVNVATLERAGATSPLLMEGLIDLTRSMIDKTRVVEEHLRRTGGEISALRDNLAEARQTANSDPLTGLANRRALDARLRDAFEKARAEKRQLSIAICDIDHFKSVNDNHGHQIGDEVIKFVAGALSKGESDRLFVSRYGGEEFVLLFEGLEPAAAAAEIDAIRRDIAGREMKVSATGRRLGRVSFSAGVCGIKGRKGPSDMLKRADAALYKAKETGRDRVLIDGADA